MASRSDSTESTPKQTEEPVNGWEHHAVLKETFLMALMGKAPAAALRKAGRVAYNAFLSSDADIPEEPEYAEPGSHVRRALMGACLDLAAMSGFLGDRGAGEVKAPESERAATWRAKADLLAGTCAALASTLRSDPTIFPEDEAGDAL